MSVYNSREIELFGKRFPIYGPIRRTQTTPFSGKMTVGDYSRDDQVIASSWVMSSFSGGTGVKYGSWPQDQDRYYFGTLNPMYRRQLVLPSKVHKVTNIGPADVMIDYSQRLFYTVGSTIYKWDESTQTSNGVGPTLSAPATAIAVYYGNMYILTQNELVEHNITADTWVTYDANEADPEVVVGIGGVAMIGWDDKLFVLTQQNEMYWTIDPSTDVFETDSPWTYSGRIPLPPGYCNQLFVFQNMLGEPVIFANTRVGLWAYDFDAGRFLQTSMTYPTINAAGEGAIVWRGEVRIPVGQEGYLFNNNVIQPAGPNRDDGLPEAYRGNLGSFISGHAFHYVTITVPGESEDIAEELLITGVMSIETSMHNNDTFANPSAGRGAVMHSQGGAWHVTSTQDDVKGRMGAGLVADIEGTHRLWFTSGNGLFWTPSPTAPHNPLQIPTMEYEQSGFLETPWFDSGWQEIPKLALSLEVFAKDITEDRFIEFWVAWDEDETWHYLGKITKNGRTSIPIGESSGKLFLSAKVRIEMQREDDDSFKTPLLRNLIFTYTRQPRKLWGWQLRVRTADGYLDRTSEDLYNELLTIANSQQAGILNFENEDGTEINTRVLVSRVDAVHGSGSEKRGQFNLSLIEMDTQPQVGDLIE